jgi:hypothetical protein
VDPRIKIIDPRLVAEFERQVGHEHIAICNLPSLVEGISRVSPTQVGQLAAAIQINLATQAPDEPSTQSDEGANSAPPPTDANGSGAGTASAEPAAEAVPAGPAAPAANAQQSDSLETDLGRGAMAGEALLAFDEDGYRDAAYEADAPSEINDVIRALKSQNWYVQNPAIESLKSLRDGAFSATSWFVLGRNIYQAACGNAQKAMNFIVNLDIQLNRFATEAADAMLAGMAFEIYFDGQGQLRTAGKSGYLDKVLSVLASDRYMQVRQFIQSKLVAADATLQFIPGEKRELPLLFRSTEVARASEADQADEVASDQGKVRMLDSVMLDGTELIADKAAEQEDPWGGFRRRYTVDEVAAEVSTELLIPKWALKRTFDPSVRPDVHFRLPRDKWLRVKRAGSNQQQ